MTIKEITAMKRTLTVILSTIAVGTAALAASFWVYNRVITNETALAYNKTYTLDLNQTPNQSGMTNVSAQAVYSSSTLSNTTFTDGRISTGSITVINNALLDSHAATNQITIAATAVILASNATNYLTVLTTSSLNGKTVTYNGNPLIGGTDWTVVATTTGTAENIKTAINHFNGVTATRSGSTVNMLARPAGTVGNSKTLAVNTSSITIGGAKFGGAHNNRLAASYLSVNGRQFQQGYAWKAMDTSSGTATSVAALLQTISGMRAHATDSVVYATATVAGTAANAFTLVSSQPSYMTVAGATFAGGRDNAQVCINGTCLTQGTAWTKTSTSTGTARAISNAIVASSALNTLLSSTFTASAVVTATSTLQGTAKNFTLTTNVPSYLTLSGATFTGGLNAAWTGGTSVIAIPSHGYGTGLGVVFTSGTVTIPGLTNHTTYYVAVIDANDIALSSSSALAQTGSYIVLGTPAITGPHTFTLAPQAFSAGSAGFFWEASNDGSNYNPIDVSSVTYSSPAGVSSTSWDFGRLGLRYLRLNVTAPTQGGIALTVTVNGQN